MNKGGREFFQGSGEPETEEQKQRREISERWVHLTKNDKELGAMLEQFDFEALKRIILEDFRRSTGSGDDELNFLGLDRIEYLSLRTGAYNIKKNTIELSRENVLRSYEGRDPRIAVAAALIHEEVHAVSRNECRGAELKASGSSVSETSGYQTFSRTVGEWWANGDAGAFEVFDEGVTEKLAREYLLKYANRTGAFSKDEMARFGEGWSREDVSMPYKEEVRVVDLIIDEISKASGFSSEMVWQAIIRGKYSGERLEDPELKIALDEVLGEGFVDSLASGLMAEFLKKHAEQDAAAAKEDARKGSRSILKYLKRILT